MPSGHPSWLVRSIGLALARAALRRTLAAADARGRGTPLAAVLVAPPVGAHGSISRDPERADRPARDAGISAAERPRRWSRGTGWSRP
jgi:hypothetical protein